MLPKALLLCTFIGAAAQSLPMVAFGAFLNIDIGMPLEEQARFYATIFLPWSLKPLYSYLMEHFPLCGSKRRAYIVLAYIGFSFSFIATALFTTNSTEMYIFSLMRSGFEALSECGLGLVTLDIVESRRTIGSDAAQVAQSQASAYRMKGSASAYVFGLLIYGCGSSKSAISNRTIIGVTSILPIIAAVTAFKLPEQDAQATPVGIEESPLDFGVEEEVSAEEWTWRDRLRIGIGILLFQFCFVWIGVQTLVPLVPWLTVLSLWVLGFIAVVAYGIKKSLLPRGPLFCSTFLFVLSAAPTYSAPWYSFQLSAFHNSTCNIQVLLMIAYGSRLLGCWGFAPISKRYLASSNETDKKRRAEIAMVFFTLFGSLICMLDIVLALDWKKLIDSSDDALKLLQFGSVAFVASFFAQLGQLSRQVYATENSYDNTDISKMLTPGILYGAYIALADFGDAAAGWISAPLTSALNLDYRDESYGLLWVLVLISQVWEVVVVILAPLIFRFLTRTARQQMLDTNANDELTEGELITRGQRLLSLANI